MGIFDNFSFENAKKNTGGLRGGLLAAGDSLGVMAQAIGGAPRDMPLSQRWGAALGAGSRHLQGSFEVQKDRLRNETYQTDALEQAEALPEGSKERMFWEAVGSGNKDQVRLLPSLWAAQAEDSKARGGSGPTPSQYSANRRTDMAREMIGRIKANPGMAQQVMAKMGVENFNQLVSWASGRKVNEPDPDYARYFTEASTSPLAGLAGLNEALNPISETVPKLNAEAGAAEEKGTGLLARGMGAVADFFGVGEEAGASSQAVPDFEAAIAAELEDAIGVQGVSEPVEAAPAPEVQMPARNLSVGTPLPQGDQLERDVSMTKLKTSTSLPGEGELERGLGKSRIRPSRDVQARKLSLGEQSRLENEKKWAELWGAVADPVEDFFESNRRKREESYEMFPRAREDAGSYPTFPNPATTAPYSRARDHRLRGLMDR